MAVELVGAIGAIGACAVATAASRGVVVRVGWLVAGGLVENDLQTGQGGERGWRQDAERLERAVVRVENDESVGRIQQSSCFGVQSAAG